VKFIAAAQLCSGSAGMLDKAPDGYQQVHKIESQARRFYVLTPEIFAGKE